MLLNGEWTLHTVYRPDIPSRWSVCFLLASRRFWIYPCPLCVCLTRSRTQGAGLGEGTIFLAEKGKGTYMLPLHGPA